MNEVLGSAVGQTKRRLLIGCLTLLIGVPVIGCCLLVMFTMILPALDSSISSGDNSSFPAWLLILGLLFVIGLIVIPVGIAGFTILRRARALDSEINPLGFVGKAYMLYGRQYQGSYLDHEADIYIYRGPTVEVRLKSSIQTRVLINPKESVSTAAANVFGKSPLQNGNPSLEAYAIYPEEETWALNLVKNPEAAEAIQLLMTHGAEWAVIRRLEIQPGEIVLYLHRSKKMGSKLIDQSALQNWLQSLTKLALAAENLPEPQEKMQSTVNNTRQSRQKISQALPYVIGAIVVGLPILFVGIGLVVYLIVSLN